MNQAILFLTNKANDWTLQAFHALDDSMKGEADVYLLYHQQGDILPDSLRGIKVFPFTSSILHDLGYQPIGESLLPGSNHFPLLKFFQAYHAYDYYWLMEDDVRYSADWKTFFDGFQENRSDFLSSQIEKYEDHPNWYWWDSLKTTQEEVPAIQRVKSFNPIYRLSHQALCVVDEYLKRGWKGHHEVLIPTLLYYKGLSIEDFGGKGCFVNPQNENRHYTADTFSEKPVLSEEGKRLLYHAVKEEKSKKPTRKNCVFMPVGDTSLHRQLLRGHADFDLHLLIYDKSYNKWCNDTDFIGCQSGYKMDMTYHYLQRHPEYLEHYDYFFLLDDDIEISTEAVNDLFRYMREFHLKIAQPSLVMSYYTYEHTLHNPTCKLRYTNFVEMMMPCFSREALVKVLPTFEEKVRWCGIEWHWPVLVDTNKRDIAIIDDVKAVHGRKIQSFQEEYMKKLIQYFQDNQLDGSISEYGYIPQAHDVLQEQGFLLFEKEEREKVLCQIEEINREVLFALGKSVKQEEIELIALLYYQFAMITGKRKFLAFVKMLVEKMPKKRLAEPPHQLTRTSVEAALLKGLALCQAYHKKQVTFNLIIDLLTNSTNAYAK